jgi:hypothetical protein
MSAQLKYHHKQTGWHSLIGHAVGFAIAFWVLSFVTLEGSMRPVMFALFAVLAATGLTFSSLITEVDAAEFRARFGPLKWPGQTVALNEIAGVLPARTSIAAGWGIRVTTRGWLYSVSGRGAVIVGLRNGKQFLIGTDDPVGLADAINTSLPQEADFTKIRGAK